MINQTSCYAFSKDAVVVKYGVKHKNWFNEEVQGNDILMLAQHINGWHRMALWHKNTYFDNPEP